MPVAFLTPRFAFKASALLLLSLAAMTAGFVMNTSSGESRNWPSTPGTIVSARVIETTQDGGKGGGVLVCHQAELSYTYIVGQKTYRNNKLSYHGAPCIHGSRGRRLAEETLARHSAQHPLMVFYDASDPRSSCLEPGRTSDGFGMILIGAAGLVLLVVYSGGRVLDRYAGIGEFSPESTRRDEGTKSISPESAQDMKRKREAAHR